MKKKKLLIVSYAPPPYHGVVQMMEIAAHSDVLREHFDVHTFYLKATAHAQDRGKLSHNTIYTTFSNLFRFVITLATVRPYLVYISLAQNTFGFLRDSCLVLLTKLWLKKVCIHFHAGDFDKSYALKSWYYKIYIRFIIRRVNRLIVLAEKIKKQFIPFIDETHIAVLYNCLPYNTLDTMSSTQRTYTHQTTTILFIGYLSKAKGAVDLVKAAPHVLARHPHTTFILCGQPVDIERNVIYIATPHNGYTEIVSRIEQDQLQEHVKLYGYIDRETKKQLLEQADIFVLPSYSEGFPISVLEAMGYGLPLIVTPVGALEEVLMHGQHALFVRTGDYKDIANAIITLIENSTLRTTMGKTNRTCITTQYMPYMYEKKLATILQHM